MARLWGSEAFVLFLGEAHLCLVHVDTNCLSDASFSLGNLKAPRAENSKAGMADGPRITTWAYGDSGWMEAVEDRLRWAPRAPVSIFLEGSHSSHHVIPENRMSWSDRWAFRCRVWRQRLAWVACFEDGAFDQGRFSEGVSPWGSFSASSPVLDNKGGHVVSVVRWCRGGVGDGGRVWRLGRGSLWAMLSRGGMPKEVATWCATLADRVPNPFCGVDVLEPYLIPSVRQIVEGWGVPKAIWDGVFCLVVATPLGGVYHMIVSCETLLVTRRLPSSRPITAPQLATEPRGNACQQARKAQQFEPCGQDDHHEAELVQTLAYARDHHHIHVAAVLNATPWSLGKTILAAMNDKGTLVLNMPQNPLCPFHTDRFYEAFAVARARACGSVWRWPLGRIGMSPKSWWARYFKEELLRASGVCLMVWLGLEIGLWGWHLCQARILGHNLEHVLSTLERTRAQLEAARRLETAQRVHDTARQWLCLHRRAVVDMWRGAERAFQTLGLSSPLVDAHVAAFQWQAPVVFRKVPRARLSGALHPLRVPQGRTSGMMNLDTGTWVLVRDANPTEVQEKRFWTHGTWFWGDHPEGTFQQRSSLMPGRGLPLSEGAQKGAQDAHTWAVRYVRKVPYVKAELSGNTKKETL